MSWVQFHAVLYKFTALQEHVFMHRQLSLLRRMRQLRHEPTH